MFSTGVSEIDKVLKGGYPEKSTILILGSSETGKEMLAYRFAEAGSVKGERCLYVTRLSTDEVLKDMGVHSVELEPSFVSWISGGDGDKRFQPDNLAGLSFDIKDSISHEGDRRTRIVVDSLSSLLALNSPDAVYRFLAQLLPDLRRHQTCFLAVLEEGMHDSKTLASMEQLFDGVLELSSPEESDMITARLKKMRGIDVQSNLQVRVSRLRLEPPADRNAPSNQLNRKRIAVLPFANMSPDPNDNYFADGMTEELISTISRIEGLEVISRTSMMRYRSAQKPIGEVAKELEVGSLVEGSIRKDGSKLRVTVQLIEAVKDRHLWAEVYDRQLEDVFEIQSDIAQRVADALQVQLLEGEKNRIRRGATRDLDAYSLYLRGRHLMYDLTERTLKSAEEQFELAISKDPNFAAAYAGVADCLFSHLMPQGVLYGNRTATAMYEKSKAMVARALELDDKLAEAHCTLGGILAAQYDYSNSEREFRRAISLDPNYAQAHHWYALLLGILRRTDESFSEIDLALRTDPLSPVIATAAGLLYWHAGRDDDAIKQWTAVKERTPGFAGVYFWLGFYNLHKGRCKEGFEYFTNPVFATQWDEAAHKSLLVYANAVCGKMEEARILMVELKDLSKRRYVRPIGLASAYLGLGDADNFFETMTRVVEEGTFIDVRRFQPMSPMRSDPRFAELLRKMNLQP